MPTTVVNMSGYVPPDAIYIGRSYNGLGEWGNKYTHVHSNVPGVVFVSSREEAVRKFEEDVRSNPELIAKIKRELKDKVLACWCHPKLCHGHVLAKIAEEP